MLEATILHSNNYYTVMVSTVSCKVNFGVKISDLKVTCPNATHTTCNYICICEGSQHCSVIPYII